MGTIKNDELCIYPYKFDNSNYMIRLRFNGKIFKSINAIYEIFELNEKELIDMLYKYHGQILKSKYIFFSTINDFNNFKQHLESILIINTLKECEG